MSNNNYFAVIDIGSNSVRLVVYSGLERVPSVVFNEKILCGLGASMGDENKMSGDAIALALSTLKRFRLLCDHMGVKLVDAVATAAVRDAENGPAFLKAAQEESGFDIRLIAGEEESRISALGVLSGEPTAEGIVGDLGGGSLELAYVSGGHVFETASLPIGPLRLMARFDGNMAAMKAHVSVALEGISWLKKGEDKSLYLVGGAWRNLARLLMKEQFVALPILHGYRLKRGDIKAYAKRISHLRPADIPFRSLLNDRRSDILPVAALILRQVLKASGVLEACVSTYGLREGLIFERLDREAQAEDPFLHQCRELAGERCRFPEHAHQLYDWLRPLFIHSAITDRQKRARLHMAACLLSDIAWRGHPDFRAEKAVEAILHGQFVGISHQGRAFIAIALNEAYGASLEDPLIGHILPLLSAGLLMEARVLGAGIRLAQRLSGGAVEALAASELRLKDKLSLILDPAIGDLSSELVEKRLAQLAQLLGRQGDIRLQAGAAAPVEAENA